MGLPQQLLFADLNVDIAVSWVTGYGGRQFYLLRVLQLLQFEYRHALRRVTVNGGEPAPPPLIADLNVDTHSCVLLQFIKGDIQSMDLLNFILEAEKIDTIMHFAAQVKTATLVAAQTEVT
jgi:hypothetical protein